ncbi:MAG: hypothetical protein LBI85_07940 [Spirochaetaceae bacterium]|jgi:gas vesicle protein|nr:hypothetical protein [Spirochaetaceae bacterium]
MALRDNNNFAFLLTNILETALKITAATYKAVEDCLSDVMDSKMRDKFNFAALLIDTGIIDIVTALLLATWTSKSAQIELKSTGAITIEAAEEQSVYIQNQSDAASPTPAITQGVWVTQLAGHLTEIGGIISEATTSIMSFVKDKNKEDEPEEL